MVFKNHVNLKIILLLIISIRFTGVTILDSWEVVLIKSTC